eukprot:scaffold19371_cov34-Prasinocladus_malaysianus.AAC.1
MDTSSWPLVRIGCSPQMHAAAIYYCFEGVTPISKRIADLRVEWHRWLHVDRDSWTAGARKSAGCHAWAAVTEKASRNRLVQNS